MINKAYNTILAGTAFASAIATFVASAYVLYLFLSYFHNMQASEILVLGVLGVSSLLVSLYLLAYVWLKVDEEKAGII